MDCTVLIDKHGCKWLDENDGSKFFPPQVFGGYVQGIVYKILFQGADRTRETYTLRFLHRLSIRYNINVFFRYILRPPLSDETLLWLEG